MWRHNVDLLAYHDLDGRSGFKLALQEAGGRFFLYVAGFWHAGWSILEVTDPEHPELLRFLDGPPNTMTIQVQVADGTMITALEHPPTGLTIGDAAAAPQDGFLICDVREAAGRSRSASGSAAAPARTGTLQRRPVGARHQHRRGFEGRSWPSSTSPTRPTPRPRALVASRAAQGGGRDLHPRGPAGAHRLLPLPPARPVPARRRLRPR
jgi:hypothetical protein